MTYTTAVCTVKNSWWWTEELSETFRVSFQKEIWEIDASSWFYYKNLSRCTVTWTSNKETVQIKFGLKISVFINPRDSGLRLQLYCLVPALCRATEISTLLNFLKKKFLFTLISANKNKNYAHQTDNSTTKLAEYQTTFNTKLLDYVVSWPIISAVFASHSPPVLLFNFHTPCSLLLRLVFLTAWVSFHVRLVPKSSTHFCLVPPCFMI